MGVMNGVMIVLFTSPGLDPTTFTYWRCCGLSSVASRFSRNPIRPFMGVLISWLMAARNRSFV